MVSSNSAARSGGDSQPPAFVRKRLAVDVLQRKVRQAVLFADLVDLHDMGVLEAWPPLRLPCESGRCRPVPRARRPESSSAPRRRFSPSCRPIHHAHPAATEFAEDLKAGDARPGSACAILRFAVRCVIHCLRGNAARRDTVRRLRLRYIKLRRTGCSHAQRGDGGCHVRGRRTSSANGEPPRSGRCVNQRGRNSQSMCRSCSRRIDSRVSAHAIQVRAQVGRIMTLQRTGPFRLEFGSQPSKRWLQGLRRGGISISHEEPPSRRH